MQIHRLNRRFHRWAGIAVALPLLIVVATGILLQLKKHWTFVQPPELRGSAREPAIDFAAILAAARGAPELGVDGWADVDRLDLRPAKGICKLVAHSGHEAQIDIGTGAVLQTAMRRSDLIESIHDGSWFGGDAVKLGLFLPVAVALLLLVLSGVWLWWHPFAVRRRVARDRESAADAAH